MFVAEFTATPNGRSPTDTDVVALVAPSITVTSLLAALTTHSTEPSGLTAASKGSPTPGALRPKLLAEYNWQAVAATNLALYEDVVRGHAGRGRG